jgi:hypothetical protein
VRAHRTERVELVLAEEVGSERRVGNLVVRRSLLGERLIDWNDGGVGGRGRGVGAQHERVGHRIGQLDPGLIAVGGERVE